MTDYAIRINIQNSQHYTEIQEYFEKLNNPYLIGPIEIGTETNKEHIHIYLKSNKKKDTLVKNMKRSSIIQTGNGSYSCVQITQKTYKTLNEAIDYYKSYCIKTWNEDTCDHLKIYTNIETFNPETLPKWEQNKKKFKKQKQQTIKEKIKNGYTPIESKNEAEAKKHIITYLLKFYKDEDKPFTSSMLRMYGNYLLLQYYETYLHSEIIYQQFFGRSEALF